MKRWHIPSMLFSLSLMGVGITLVPQAAYAKMVGPAIGRASASLTNCTQTTCTITLTVTNVKLTKGTEYDAYLSSSVCPDLSGTSYGPVKATADNNSPFAQ